MANTATRADWADDFTEESATVLPPPQTTVDPKTGIKTTITYRLDDDGRRIKTTRRTRNVVVKEKLTAAEAERKQWAKFGLEKGKPRGPSMDTTTIGENILFKPSRDWKTVQADEEKPGGGKAEEKSLKEQLKDKKVKCRICQGEHFTARCPFKDTMTPMGEDGNPVADPLAEDDEKPTKEGGLGMGGSSYVPPHMRKGASGGGDKLGGKYERDDLATLRVTNVSEMAEEDDLRQIFEHFGRVTRVFLAKDRETGRAKGFAFISFVDRADAARACEKLDGFGYKHLILRVEFAKRTT